MKSIVVIGANGFLGTALVNKLIMTSYNVYAIANKNINNINSKAIILSKTDFFNSELKFDFIFFLSGNYLNTYKELIDINHDLYLFLNKFSESKFIYISSTNVYGQHDGPIYENSSFNHPSIYASSKLSGEFLISSLKSYSIIRFTYLYGPNLNNGSFLPLIISSAKVNNRIILKGDGNRYQDYLHLDDAVDLCILSMHAKENKIYLGATGVKITNNHVANIISKYTGCSINYNGEETSYSFSFNPSETFNILKWRPKIPFDYGLKSMII